MRVAIAFEYPTVNGGENSMFAVLQWLLDNMSRRELEVVAICPPVGAVRDRLDALGVEVVAFDRHAVTEGAANREQRTVNNDVADAADKRGGGCARPQPPAKSEGKGRNAAQTIPSREVQIEALRSSIAVARLDVLHANSLAMGRLLGAAAARLPCPATAHLRDILKLSKAAIRDLNQNARLIAVSQATREFHIAQGLTADRSSVVYNGVRSPEEHEPRSETRARIRNELGIPADASVLLTVGQIGLRKGLDTLAESARLLAAKGCSLHWLIAGERFSQKQESVDFERQVFATFQQAAPQVTTCRLGYRRDIADLMRASDLLIHGARQEPLGRVLLEAASLKLPIVATDVGGTREILEDDISALLVPADDSAAMTAAIERLLDTPDERQRLADAAALRVVQNFSVRCSAMQLIGLWRSVCEDKKSRPEA